MVDVSDVGPVRCARCKAYMNPYMRWNNNGRNFTCNFCGLSNNTPDHYFNHLGPDGRRRDAGELRQHTPGVWVTATWPTASALVADPPTTQAFARASSSCTISLTCL